MISSAAATVRLGESGSVNGGVDRLALGQGVVGLAHGCCFGSGLGLRPAWGNQGVIPAMEASIAWRSRRWLSSLQGRSCLG